jgi:fructose-1,6-bisphosphatase
MVSEEIDLPIMCADGGNYCVVFDPLGFNLFLC